MRGSLHLLVEEDSVREDRIENITLPADDEILLVSSSIELVKLPMVALASALVASKSPIVRFELVMASSFVFASSSHHMEYSSISLDSFSRSEATLQPMRCLPHHPPVVFCDLQDSSAFQWKRADPQLSLHADFRKKISERKELRIAVEAQLNYEPPQTPALTFPFSSSNS